MIRIQEIFTKTVQGEGSWSGIRADFIRLWGCPVNPLTFSKIKDFG